MNKTRRYLTYLLLFFILITSGLSAQDDGKLEEIPFFLTFVPNVQFAPVYVAIEHGYAAQNGVELVLEHGDEPVGVDLIAAGRIPMGIISGEQVLMARAAERPVVYIYEWFQLNPIGIVIPNTSDIETATDLTGKTVGIPGRFGATYSGLTAFLAANDMIENDLSLETIGYAAPDVVCTGQLDASVVYLNNEPLQIRQRANANECGDITSVSVISVADTVDLVSNGLVTNEELIAENPELVQRLVDTFDRGLQDVIENPAQAYLVSLNYVENLPANEEFITDLESASMAQIEFLATNPDRDAIATSRSELLVELQSHFPDDVLIQLEVLLETIKLWDADRLGYSEATSWETTQDVLLAMETIENGTDVNAAFTNEFVPPPDEVE